MIYIVFDELGRRPTEDYMLELEEKIRAVDGVSRIDMACINDSVEAAEMLSKINMNDPKNWGKVKIVMIPMMGEIKGYLPRSLLEEFKTSAAAGRSSYDVFKEILDDDLNGGGGA